MLICSEINKLGDLLHQANIIYTKMENYNNYRFFFKDLFDDNVQDFKNIIKEIYEKTIHIENCIEERED